MMRAAVLAVAMLALLARSAGAHPIHTTLTVITPARSGHVLTFNIRVFADDFSASVAKFAGRRPPPDSSVVGEEVTRYVRAQFTVAGADGVPSTLEPCGVRRSNELYWLCFRANVAAGARVRNQMLTELHSDQVNIVQLEKGNERKSFLFTKGSAASTMPD